MCLWRDYQTRPSVVGVEHRLDQLVRFAPVVTVPLLVFIGGGIPPQVECYVSICIRYSLKEGGLTAAAKVWKSLYSAEKLN